MTGAPPPAKGRRSALARWLRRARPDLTPLRAHGDFRLVLAARSTSLFGTMITSVAIPYQVYQLTRSSLAVGALGLVELGALLAFALALGLLADARDRRRMLMLTEIGLLLATGALAVNATLAHPAVWALFAAAALAAAMTALQRPSLDALLPRLVDSDQQTAAGALQILASQPAVILGPALAGLLLASAGPAAAYGLDLLTFLISLGCLAMVRAMPPAAGAAGPSLRRVAEGLAYARRRPELLATYLVDLVAMVFGMPSALFPAISEGLGGAAVLGLLYAAPGAGSLLFTATSGWTSGVRRHGAAVLAGAMLWGAAVAGFGLATGLGVALACLMAAGAADSMSGVFRMTIWNQTIPDHLRGRLASIELLSYGSGPGLGDFEAGVVANVFGVRASVVSGGLLCIAGCAACALLLPALWTYDSGRPPAGGTATALRPPPRSQ